MVIWGICLKNNGRNEDRFLNYLKLVKEELPRYCKGKYFSKFTKIHGDTIEGNVSNSTLKLVCRKSTKDSNASTYNKLTERCLKYCLNKKIWICD